MNRDLNLMNAVKFLIKSVDSKTGGSAASFSRLYYPLKGWSNPYPETTGYIIPTFLNLSENENFKELNQISLKMGEWFLSIQNEDGSFPGGTYPSKTNDKSIFNTAQIIIGLVSLYKVTEDKKYYNSFYKAALWLSKNQESDGSWKKFQYFKSFSPSYYTRVAWPMLMAYQITNDKTILDSAVLALDFVLSKVQKNHMIKDCGFQPDTYAFLHTISYTIRGFLESFLILEDKKYFDVAYNLSFLLLRKYELKKKLSGAYYEDLKSIDWYRCITGEAQLAIIWLKIFKFNNDIRFLNSATKLIDSISKTQIKRSGLIFKKGGVLGSYPFYGRYISFRQPNWATKFYIDALILEQNLYQKLENE